MLRDLCWPNRGSVKAYVVNKSNCADKRTVLRLEDRKIGRNEKCPAVVARSLRGVAGHKGAQQNELRGLGLAVLVDLAQF